MKNIAILLATYNGGKYIKSLLDSLLNQSYQNFVCYIHDDGSTDDTFEVCRNYSWRYPEKFRILYYGHCGGAKENFFSMVKNVEEPYLMFCDQDDIWHIDKIEKSINSIKKEENNNPNKAVLCYSDLKIVDENLSVIANSYFDFTRKNPKDLSFSKALIQGFVPGCTFIMNRALYLRLNEYMDLDCIYMHDWWTICLAFALGGCVSFISEPLIDYRQHQNNTLGVQKATIFTALKNLFRDVNSGELFRKKRNWIWRSRNIAGQLLNIDNIDPDCKTLCKQLYEIDKKNKIMRILFYIKNFKGYRGLPYMLFWI